MPRFARIATAFLLLPGFALLAVGCRPSEPEPRASADPGVDATGTVDDAPPVPPATPTLEVTTLDGAAWSLAGHRGRWVVVNYWATWCTPCLKEMPELSALDAMREHIEVIGLAYEDITPVEMRAFLERHPVVYPIAILDTAAPPADFETPRGLPMTWLIDPDGEVAKKFVGPVTAQDIEAVIDQAGVDGGGRAGA